MRALLRLLLLFGLVAFLVHSVRRALTAGRQADGPRQPRERGGSLPPERLVCGACGSEFNPDQSGWICPKCGK
jgi:hypothetical protein